MKSIVDFTYYTFNRNISLPANDPVEKKKKIKKIKIKENQFSPENLYIPNDYKSIKNNYSKNSMIKTNMKSFLKTKLLY